MTTYQGKITLMVAGPATKLSKAPLGVRLQKAGLIIFGVAFFAGILCAGAYIKHWTWLYWVAGSSMALGGGIGIFVGIKTEVAPCPFCGSMVGLDSGNDLTGIDDNEPAECQKCYERLISDKGELRPIDGETFIAKRDKCRAPLFDDLRWPDECLTCGAPATRFEKIADTSVSGAALLVGKIRTRSASVNNVPYCAQHGAQVSMGFESDQAKLKFEDLDAMRRYVAMNFGKKPLTAK